MTREEKIAEARRMRAEGHKLREIRECFGVGCETALRWTDDAYAERARAACRQAKERYRGICEKCGGPTNGSNGPGPAAKVCRSCLEWPEGKVIEAMQRWAREYGRAPTSTEWCHARNGYPTSHVSVIGRVGWSELLVRAGLTPRRDWRPETQARVVAMFKEGRSCREIADEFGWTSTAVRQRLERAGLWTRKPRRQKAPA